MPPGPPDRSPNRFSILSEHNISTDYSNAFPILTQKQTPLNHPKYLTISSLDNSLAKLSPFVIKKCIDAISTQVDNIKQLREGSLLILARNGKVAEKFLKTKSLANLCQVSAKLHDNLNTVKGTVYAPCLINVKDEEIVEELKSQGVTKVYKFTNTHDGKTTPTGKMVLSFDLFHIPKTLDVAWYKLKVKPYFPSPMRCRNCQRLGHTKNRCSNPATCDGCNLPPYNPTNCTRNQCANCGDTHPSSDKNCPRFKQMKDVLQIKTIHKCSLDEAFKKYNLNNPPSDTSKRTYANTAKESETTPNNSHARQNELHASHCKSALPITDHLKRPASPSKNSREKIPKTTAHNNEHQPTTNTVVSTSNTNNKDNHTENTSTINLTTSPFSIITKNLISNNDYYIPATETNHTDDKAN